MSTTDTADGSSGDIRWSPWDNFLRAASRDLHHECEIGHLTFQIETDGEGCKLAPDHVV
jgi:hypothetical protein